MKNIDRLLSSPEEFGIYEYTWNEDGTLDVFQDVDLSYLDLESLPFDFNIIKGNFNCNKNNLSSLMGSPKQVFGDFNCAGNELLTLQYGPLIVTGEYNCNENKLPNLRYIAKDVQIIRCSHNGMTSLRGAPSKIPGSFICMHNDLTSLEWGPLEVGDVCNFQYNYNTIKSLKGIPEKVSGTLYCDDDVLKLIQPSYQDVSGIRKIVGKTGQIDESGKIVPRRLY